MGTPLKRFILSNVLFLAVIIWLSRWMPWLLEGVTARLPLLAHVAITVAVAATLGTLYITVVTFSRITIEPEGKRRREVHLPQGLLALVAGFLTAATPVVIGMFSGIGIPLPALIFVSALSLFFLGCVAVLALVFGSVVFLATEEPIDVWTTGVGAAMFIAVATALGVLASLSMESIIPAGPTIAALVALLVFVIRHEESLECFQPRPAAESQ